ncbi:hypothetical protein Tco_0558269 [Tanacetum coccineum]
MVSPLDNNEINFNISFDESYDEDYMIVFDENSFSCKIISFDNLKTDSENGNDKINIPSSLSPEPTIGYFDDLDFFKGFENEFLAIVYNDLKSKSGPLNEPSVSSKHIDKFETSLSEYDENEQNILCLSDSFSNNPKTIKDNDDSIDITRLSGTHLLHRDLRHPWLRYQVDGLTDGMRKTPGDRLSMVCAGDNGEALFTSHAWRTLFELDGARRRMTWRTFILALGLHFEEEMAEHGFEAYYSGSERVIPDKGDLRDYWIEISSDKDFLGLAPSYVHIRDPMRRLCHRMLACSISGRGHGAEKVVGVDLFYLWTMDRRTAKAAAAGALGAAEGAPTADECAQAVPAPVKAPQPPPPLQIKIVELEKVLTQNTKDFDDVKLELPNITAKFEAYFEKLENTKVVLERQLAHKTDDSKVEKDQFLKEINHLRTQLENLKGKSVETKFDKPSISGKPPSDKLLINSQISKSWFTPKVVMQKDYSTPVTAQSLSKNEKDHLLKRIASLESKLASQDIRSCQKKYHELRTSYNALKVKFDSSNRKKGKIMFSTYQNLK